MVFYLTDSLITDSADPEYKDVNRVINNFMTAVQERNHLILGDLACLEWARRFYTPENIIYGILTHLLNNYATSTIPAELTEYVRVVKGNKSKTTDNGVTIYSLPYQEFNSSDTVSKMRIVGEDENDSKFYGYVRDWYQTTIGTSYATNHIDEHGGGVNTHKKVSNLKSLKMPFVCIVDTDQRFPSSPCGDTYAKCKALTYIPPLEHFHFIEAHEIENILPKSIIDILPSCCAYNNATVKNYYASIFNNITDKSHWRYIDLKSGIKKKNEMLTTPAWLNFSESIYNLNEHRTDDFQEKLSATLDKGSVFPGLSSGILKEAVEHLKNNGVNNITGFLDFQRDEWLAIGKLLLNKCICASQEAMNY